jgi:hypothetical protein
MRRNHCNSIHLVVGMANIECIIKRIELDNLTVKFPRTARRPWTAVCKSYCLLEGAVGSQNNLVNNTVPGTHIHPTDIQTGYAFAPRRQNRDRGTQCKTQPKPFGLTRRISLPPRRLFLPVQVVVALDGGHARGPVLLEGNLADRRRNGKTNVGGGMGRIRALPPGLGSMRHK